MTPRRHRLWLAPALAGLAVFGWVASGSYRARDDPQAFLDSHGDALWMLGPPAPALNEAAEARMASGLRALNDTTRPASERLSAYRDELEAARRLLVPSLRARPAQPQILSELAAIRWDLDGPDAGRDLELIETAAAMHPTQPTVQLDLGELLLKTGRIDEARAYLRRAVELKPALAAEVIDRLADHGSSPSGAARALPRTPETLAALRSIYFDARLEDEYILLVEPFLAEPTPALLAAYAAAHRRLGRFDALVEALDALGDFPDPAAESARLAHRATALIELGFDGRAMEDAERALELNPGSVWFAEHLGRVALRAARDERAIEAFRLALRRAASGSVTPLRRARLYLQVGRAEERLQRMDRAYDAYRMAVRLDPEAEVARDRMQAMRRAAGFDAGS